MIDKALGYAAKGRAVFPIHSVVDGQCSCNKSECGNAGKHPRTKNGLKDATTDQAQIKEWWNKWPDANIGMPTGQGTLVVDIDLPDGVESLATLEEQYNPLPPTLEVKTGSGGRHLFFSVDSEIRNSAEKLGKKIDTRGDGGYVILPPSTHKSGNCYQWANNTPIAKAPNWLLEKLNRPKEKEHTPTTTPGQYGQKALADELAELTGTGEGSRNDRLNQAAYYLGQIVAGGEIDRSQVKVALLSAAVSIGLPKQEALKTIQSGLEAGMREPRSILSKSNQAATANSAIIAINNEWPELLPLQPDVEQLEYPIDSLPKIIGDAVRSYHKYGQQPLSIIANSALANISLACQCHCDVARDNALTGPISLFFLSIAESGERKSTVDKAFGSVARQWLREQQHQVNEVIKELTPKVRGWEAIESGLINQLKNKNANKEQVQSELDQHYRNKIELPKLPELFLSDTNQASLMSEISNNAFYGCSLWDDEGGNIVGGNGTGSDNVTAYFAVINKLWDGSQATQKRTGGNRIVDGRRLTANIMVQEAVANQLINGNKGLSRGSGLLARFLITNPESTMGKRLYQEARDFPALDEFGARTVELHRHSPTVDEYDRLDLPLLHFDGMARNIWQDFYNDTEETLKPYGEFVSVKDVVSKIADNAARIAANFHVFQFGVNGKINPETMTQASMIALFHLTEARRVYGTIGNDATEYQDAIKLLDWMTSQNFEKTNKSTIMQRGPNPLRSKAALDPVLSLLYEHGITRVVESGKAKIVEVNPEYIARRYDDQSC